MANSNNQGQTSPPPPYVTYGDAEKKLYWFGAALSFLVSIGLYVKTMAASSSFWDAGEFIAAAYSLGIPHSPGTPLYVLVGRVFTELPVPFYSIAERVNLLSAVCGALGSLLVYILVIRFLDFILDRTDKHTDALIKVVSGIVGALFITASDTYWNNSIEAEVYAMSTALMGTMTWMAIKWGDKPREAKSTLLIYLLFYLLALSVGFHLGTMLAFTGVFFYVLMTKDKAFSNLEFIVACAGVGIFVADATLYRDGQLTLGFLVAYLIVLVWMYGSKRRLPIIASALFILGLSVHLYLKIRSGHNPAIDEGDPETWRGLYGVLRREQYPEMTVHKRKADFLFQLQHFNAYFQAQFQMASAYVSKLNIGSLVPVGLGIWGMVDQFSKHRKTFIMLFATLVVVSLGLIVFLNFSDSEVRDRDYFYSPAFYYFAIYIGIGAGSLLGEIRGLFSRLGANARPMLYIASIVLIALPVFTLKHHYFTHDRSNNYTCPVYARNMLIGLEKDAVIFTNGDNDTFPLWYIQEVEGYRKDIKVVNLSLLNTPWYIRQCRDNEPKVPITWSDDALEQLRPVPTKEGWLLVRDLAVRHILGANEWKKPIYFAVTIPPETYEPYRDFLEMEGLAYRVVPKKEKNMINVPKLERNIRENFKYTGILDDNWKRNKNVYLPPHTEHLIQNYAAAFIQLAFIQHRDSLFAEAVENMKIAHEISPRMQPPLQLLPYYYLDIGDTAAAIQFSKQQIEKHPDDLDLLFRLAGIYERTGDVLESLEILDRLTLEDPENRNVYMASVGMALRAGRTQRAQAYLSNWLQRHPADMDARQYFSDLDRQLGEAAPTSP